MEEGELAMGAAHGFPHYPLIILDPRSLPKSGSAITQYESCKQMDKVPCAWLPYKEDYSDMLFHTFSKKELTLFNSEEGEKLRKITEAKLAKKEKDLRQFRKGVAQAISELMRPAAERDIPRYFEDEDDDDMEAEGLKGDKNGGGEAFSTRDRGKSLSEGERSLKRKAIGELSEDDKIPSTKKSSSKITKTDETSEVEGQKRLRKLAQFEKVKDALLQATASRDVAGLLELLRGQELLGLPFSMTLLKNSNLMEAINPLKRFGLELSGERSEEAERVRKAAASASNTIKSFFLLNSESKPQLVSPFTPSGVDASVKMASLAPTHVLTPGTQLQQPCHTLLVPPHPPPHLHNPRIPNEDLRRPFPTAPLRSLTVLSLRECLLQAGARVRAVDTGVEPSNGVIAISKKSANSINSLGLSSSLDANNHTPVDSSPTHSMGEGVSKVSHLLLCGVTGACSIERVCTYLGIWWEASCLAAAAAAEAEQEGNGFGVEDAVRLLDWMQPSTETSSAPTSTGVPLEIESVIERFEARYRAHARRLIGSLLGDIEIRGASGKIVTLLREAYVGEDSHPDFIPEVRKVRAAIKASEGVVGEVRCESVKKQLTEAERELCVHFVGLLRAEAGSCVAPP